MNRFRFTAVIAFSLLALLGGCTGAVGRGGGSAALAALDSRRETDVLPVFPMDRWVLPNGLTVMLAKDDELPLVSGMLFTRGGTLWESPEDFGTVSAMGDEMRLGGAGDLSPDALDETLERLAAGISSAVGQEFGRVGFSCLESDFEQVFKLFSDVVLRPKFDEGRLALWRNHALESIKRRADNPSSISSISFNELLFGESVYGRVLSSDQVKTFDRVGLLRSHRRFIRPNGAVLVLSGKIDRARVEQLVAERFGVWEPASKSLPPPPAIEGQVKPGIYFLAQPLQQSTIIAGQRGVQRFTPDYIAIDGFNNIFGAGGFGSRLLKNVRTEGGLAYAVFGAIQPGTTQGKNVIYLQTRTDATGPALLKALGELLKMKSEPISSEELNETKGALVNSFVFEFDTPARVLSRRATQELLAFPKDFDERYIPQVQALTAEDLQTVAQRRWDFNQFVILVVGNPEVYSQLEQIVAAPPDFLKGVQLKKVRFGEHLEMEK